MKRIFLMALLLLVWAFPVSAAEFYISPTGSDTTGTGSVEKPWKSISKAIQSVPDTGSTIIARDGLYVGTQSFSRHFRTSCTVRAEHPYQARFSSPKDGNRVLYLSNASNIILDGLEFFGSGATAPDYLIQISTDKAHDLILRNCIIHDSYKNDLIKINDHANRIVFTGCVFYNQANRGGDEHFDINTVRNIIIEESLFFNDYPGSGRPDEHNAHSFIVIKNSGSTPNVTSGITLRKNIFTNWSGKADQAFVLLGEDGKDFFEASDVLIENNLFLHNGGPRIIGTFLFKGGLRRVTVRSNTISGRPNSRGFSVFGVVCQNIGKNPPMEDILFANNIFSDNSGSIKRLSSTYAERFLDGGFRAVNNLYWNAGRDIGAEEKDLFQPENDPQAILGDPKLNSVPQEPIVPRYDLKTDRFPSGTKTIREEFERLVRTYAEPGESSAASGRADSQFLPKDDILGRPRTGTPNVGCY